MVLEQIIGTGWLQRRPLFAAFLGLAYTFIGAITGYLFFQNQFSTSLLFLIALLLVPSLMGLLSIEEEREKQEGIRRFFHNHTDVFEIYLFLSIGVFLGYIILLWFSAGLDWNMQSTVGEQLKILGPQITVGQIQQFEENSLVHALGLFSKNVGVAVIFFILSFFYGAGAIFLMVWNASIFATFVYVTISNISKGVYHGLSLLGIFSAYIVPEIGGFLLAAIAGGELSKAMVSEQFMSESFKNVLRDAVVLLLCAFVLLLLAAFLEAYVGVKVIKSLV